VVRGPSVKRAQAPAPSFVWFVWFVDKS